MEPVTGFFYFFTDSLVVEVGILDSRLDHIHLYEPQIFNKKSPEIDKSELPWLQKLSQEFENYFAGKQARFSLQYPLAHQPSPFYKIVYKELQNSSPGKTLTYKQLAELSNSPRAARAVGSAMSKNPYPLIIPCHRVLPSHGKNNGAYSAGNGEATKNYLLNLERQLFISHMEQQ
ncbi:MAG: methylated-DNA--[protein]-cysteine S-methyltransferase [Bdellovibrionia bacterium]